MNQAFFIREKIIQAIRKFFAEQDFHEVMTPVLNHALPVEPNLYAFRTTWQTLAKTKILYLSTSPEAALKKMLAAGLEKCYAIGSSFRNLEPTDVEHNPEFLMLEWYRTQADYQQIMQDVQALLLFIQQEIKTDFNLTGDWPRISLAEKMEQVTGMKFLDLLKLEKLKTISQEKNYQTNNATWEALFNQIFISEIEPQLPQTPCFLVDFPAIISPLCAEQIKRPELAQRFEFYWQGLEIGNGNTENLETEKIKYEFEQELKYRQKHNLLIHTYDENFLTAIEKLKQQNNQCAGIGLGIDRLAMLFAGAEKISQVNPFCL